jgi:hypothetical protein
MRGIRMNCIRYTLAQWLRHTRTAYVLRKEPPYPCWVMSVSTSNSCINTEEEYALTIELRLVGSLLKVHSQTAITL